jgi:hypothetical protein
MVSQFINNNNNIIIIILFYFCNQYTKKFNLFNK